MPDIQLTLPFPSTTYMVKPGQNIQAAIDQAKNDGGGIVTPMGEHEIMPLILPRSGTDPSRMVHLVGLGRGLTKLRGAPGFPPGRALIEWENTHARAYEQRISDMTLIPPYVDGTRAIHYKLNDGTTYEKVDAERLQIVMENLHIGGTNEFQESLIRLEGYTGYSRFVNITGDPWIKVPIHETILFDVDYLVNNEPFTFWDGGDSPGMCHCTLENIHAGWFQGGVIRVFKGRMVRSTMRNVIAGIPARSQPYYDFYNSYGNVFDDISTEGGGSQPLMRFTDCKFNTFRNVGIGWSTDMGLGVGNGIELIRCHDNRFDTRSVGTGNPTFNMIGGKKLIKIDATSRRNVFTNWGVIANPGEVEVEFQIDADIANGNRIEYVDTISNTTGVLTGT